MIHAHSSGHKQEETKTCDGTRNMEVEQNIVPKYSFILRRFASLGGIFLREQLKQRTPYLSKSQSLNRTR